MTVFGLVLFLNFRFFEAYRQTDIFSDCSDWFCRKLSLARGWIRNITFMILYVNSIDHVQNSWSRKQTLNIHSYNIYLTAISIELAQSLQRNCRKPLKSSVSGIRAQKYPKTATPFDKTEFKKINRVRYITVTALTSVEIILC